MSTILEIQYLKSSDYPDLPVVKEIKVSVDKRVQIRRTVSGSDVVTDFNFSAVSDVGIGTSGNGHVDTLYEYSVMDGNLYAKIVAPIPADTEFPDPAYAEVRVDTVPHEVFVASGVAADDILPTEVPSWLPTDLTYAEKQELSVRAVKDWRDQLIIWNKKALDYLHLMDNLGNHLGRVLSRADAVIKKFFQDPDVDPLIVRQIALEAAKGPQTIEDPLVMFRNLRQLALAHPNGFSFAAIWVETRNLTSPADVVRKILVDVIQNADERYDYPANYDSTDDTWIVENQPGVVAYDNTAPGINDTVVATLSDPDGGLANVVYQWEQEVDGNWRDIPGENSNSHTMIVSGDHRCRVSYDDNYGSGQRAVGSTLAVA